MRMRIGIGVLYFVKIQVGSTIVLTRGSYVCDHMYVCMYHMFSLNCITVVLFFCPLIIIGVVVASLQVDVGEVVFHVAQVASLCMILGGPNAAALGGARSSNSRPCSTLVALPRYNTILTMCHC